MLEVIPTLISQEDNTHMTILSTEEEVKEAVFQLSGSSSAGPDGFTGYFFQVCWDIVSTYVSNMVKAFFCG